MEYEKEAKLASEESRLYRGDNVIRTYGGPVPAIVSSSLGQVFNLPYGGYTRPNDVPPAFRFKIELPPGNYRRVLCGTVSATSLYERLPN